MATIVATSIAACASKSKNITASYVSPLAYSSFTCNQLEQEAERISVRLVQATGAQDRKATGDAVATAVGVIIFWPALLMIDGDSTTAPELARLKGEMEAIEKASIEKNCKIQFKREEAQKPEPQPDPGE